MYVAVGIDTEGRTDVLGLWTCANEGAKFWLQVLTEIRLYAELVGEAG